jgi:uncharacterized membrane protein
MFMDPLHPAIVHLPIALAVLLPIGAAIALFMIHRRTPARRAWALVTTAALLLFAGSWVAVTTGEREEEVVEDVVSDAALETHEEAGELFMVLSGITAALIALGLAGGTVGRVARPLGTMATIPLLILMFRVGHSGGELVYTHGAAQAYASDSAVRADTEGDHSEEHEHEREGR